jgi:2-dehydro-3-deoxyphosphogluconate aldolase / (4S)-4-hydroxy-2-oxoglutarate aldolase
MLLDTAGGQSDSARGTACPYNPIIYFPVNQSHPPTTPRAFPEPLLEQLRLSRIIAVTVIDDPENAQILAETLLESGINAIELTLRTPKAFECLAVIRNKCPDMISGVGTVLTTAQVRQAVEEGAAFGVAPGMCAEVVKAAEGAGLPFAPGIMTPSDIEAAVNLNCRLLKFFPAEPVGGIRFLSSLSAPYAHLDLEFIPLGGLTFENFTDYLALGSVPAIGGSWIAPREAIKGGDWKTIRANACDAVARLNGKGNSEI